jgi:hypothetical protein
VLNEQEKDGWCSLKSSGMEFDEYVSCDAGVSVCDIQSVYQIMQDHLTCEDEEKQEEEEMEDKLIQSKVSFFDALQGLEAARKYIQQFDVEHDMLVTCSKLENMLYTLKHQEKHKQITGLDWLKK